MMKKFCLLMISLSIMLSAIIFIYDYFGNPFFYSLANKQISKYINERYELILTYTDILYDKASDSYVGTAADYNGVEYTFIYIPDSDYIYDGYYYDSIKVYKMSMRQRCLLILSRNCELNGKIDDIVIEKIEIEKFKYKLSDTIDSDIKTDILIRLNGFYDEIQFSEDSLIISKTLAVALKNINNIRITTAENDDFFDFRFFGGCCPYDIDSTRNLINIKNDS
ncbi:MAG: hypothetical protein A2Y17_12650 [Clostridiales bacterium GWF2_38_85]|nr:MAG: hypothetical protein A2Y17_12650 [Clostridiales bacterium GWF2_38_85]HBL84108.1 hypothetical protein [Clostridiales bacterium]